MLFKALLVFLLVVPGLSYPSGCGCCCCGCGIPQEDLTTTTTTTEAPTTTETARADPESCCCSYTEVQEDPATTTTTTTTTEAPRKARVGCCCGCIAGQSVPPLESVPPQDPLDIEEPVAVAEPMPAEDLMEYKEPVYPISPEKVCPDGFRRIEDSCFYIEMEKLSYDQAEKRCSDKGGSLFAPVSQAQWDEVTSMTPPYFWTWTGIKKTTSMEDPHFEIEGAMDASSVNWLMRPYSDASNGWSSMATCAAFYNMEKSTSNYVYFYPCSLQYHSVCQTGLMDPVVSNQLRRMRFKLRHRY